MNQRIKDCKEVFDHKLAFLQVRRQSSVLTANISLTRALMHDTVKMIMILVVGDKIATKLHRRFSGHHQEVRMSDKQKWEAFCDWECARFTKPTKPLNGIQTWIKYYSHVDMSVQANSF